MKEDLEKSVCGPGAENMETYRKKKVQGTCQLLAPFCDENGTWRVGGRSRTTIPYTKDNRPEILLPQDSRYTELAMLQAHKKAHVGVEATVVQFRSDGH